MDADFPLSGRTPAEPKLAGLFRAHATAAERLAYLICGDASLAEDAVQEAFVRLAGRFRDMREPAAFDAYLRRTVVNVLRAHYRRRKLHLSWVERRAAERQRHPSIPDVEGRDQIVRALLQLPARQREALALRFYADLSEAQTAEALGCRVGTVKSMTSRGLAALRELLRGENDE